MVNKANVQILVDALRSGKYVQCTGALCRDYGDGSRQYCCLGVATVEAIKAGAEVTDTGTGEGPCGCSKCTSTVWFSDGAGHVEASRLTEKVREFYGFASTDPSLIGDSGQAATATRLNDKERYDFARIADAFERTYLQE